MGQTLDKPVTKKETTFGKGSYLSYGCSCMQGFRLSMEDQHTTIVDAPLENFLEYVREDTSVSFFGVYDGHSGQSCAKYLSNCLFDHIMGAELAHRKNAKGRMFDNDEVIKKVFLTSDYEFTRRAPSTRPGESSGSTCTTVFLVRTGNEVEIICANVGDSRIVMRHGNGNVEPLSYDHKPTNKEEKQRILNSGAYVEFGRVNGSLALSRAFGDVGYKLNTNIPQEKQAVIALPDIKRVKTTIPKNDEFQFIIAACDGIWDVMSNEQACEFVYQRLVMQKEKKYYEYRIQEQIQLLTSQGESEETIESMKNTMIQKHEERQAKKTYDLESIVEDLLDEAVLRLDSKDNVSAIIILFEKE